MTGAVILTENDETSESLERMAAFVSEIKAAGVDVEKIYCLHIQGEAPLRELAGSVIQCLKEAGAAAVMFYGSRKGKCLGSLVAAMQEKECLSDVLSVGSRQAGDGICCYANRKVYSAHLNCRVDFCPEHTVLIASPHGRQLLYHASMWDSRAVQATDPGETITGIRFLSRTAKEQGPDLSREKLVFIGGKGLGSMKNFKRLEALAKKCGAALGCTRPVAMAGWADFSKVVGISGSSLTADLCVTFGVSGSAAFSCGVEHVKKLVAINTDKNAPIFLNAQKGILGDCCKILDNWESGEE